MSATDDIARELNISRQEARKFAVEVQRLCAVPYKYTDILEGIKRLAEETRTPLHVADLMLREKRPNDFPPGANSPFIQELLVRLQRITPVEVSYTDIENLYQTLGKNTPVERILSSDAGDFRRILEKLNMNYASARRFFQGVQRYCPGPIDTDDLLTALERLDERESKPLFVANLINCEKWPGFPNLDIPEPYLSVISGMVYQYTAYPFSKPSISDAIRLLGKRATIQEILEYFAKETPIDNIAVTLNLDLNAAAQLYREIHQRFGNKIDETDVIQALDLLVDSGRNPRQLIIRLEIFVIADELQIELDVATNLANDLNQELNIPVDYAMVLRALEVMEPGGKEVSELRNLIKVTWELDSEFSTVAELFRMIRAELGPEIDQDSIVKLCLALDDADISYPDLRLFIQEYQLAMEFDITMGEARLLVDSLNSRPPKTNIWSTLVTKAKELDGGGRTAKNILLILDALELADQYNLDYVRARILSDLFVNALDVQNFVTRNLEMHISQEIIQTAINSTTPLNLSKESLLEAVREELLSLGLSVERRDVRRSVLEIRVKSGQEVSQIDLIRLLKYSDDPTRAIDQCVQMIWISEKLGLDLEQTGELVSQIKKMFPDPEQINISDMSQAILDGSSQITNRAELEAYYQIVLDLGERGWDGSPELLTSSIKVESGITVPYGRLESVLRKIDLGEQLPDSVVEWFKEEENIPELASKLSLKYEVARRLGEKVRERTNRQATYHDMLNFADSIPTNINSISKKTDWMTFLALDAGAESTRSELLDLVNYLSEYPRSRDIYWDQIAILSRSGKMSFKDALNIHWIYQEPYLARSQIKPDPYANEQWIRKERLKELARRGGIAVFDRQHHLDTLEDLRRLRNRAWQALSSDSHRYQVPSQGRAILQVSNKIQELIALESVRFVSESAKAPEVYIGFKFAMTPYQIGLVKVCKDGRVEGFHRILSQSRFYELLIDTIAMTYYRDLVLSTIYQPGSNSYQRSRGYSKTYGGQGNLSSPSSNKRPHTRDIPRKIRPKQKRYSLDDWREAQHIARHYVVGHTRFIAPGFIADRERHELAARAGIKLPPGYTWVVPHYRGDPNFGRIVLAGFDLPSQTIFYHPTRASRELDRILSGQHLQ